MNWFIFYATFGGTMAFLCAIGVIATAEKKSKYLKYWILVLVLSLATFSLGVSGLPSNV